MKSAKRDFARELRERQTPTEKRVWSLLRDRKLLGLKFRRQHVIEGFVVDFYCHEYKLAIEVDGGIHKRQKEYDRLRQDAIEAKDITVIRVNNEDLENNRCALIQKIKEVIPTLVRIPSPFGRGRCANRKWVRGCKL
ncbi:MAG: endonuclease domain-containing protein [Candidatus Margulisiibacteriota bacterium]